MNKKAVLYGLMFLVVFGYTAYVIAVDGYTSIPYAGISSLGAFQITLDLVAALLLVVFWIYQDAQQRSSNPWPWILGTCFMGTSVPLLYMFVREQKSR
ncbi:MAG: DUF2834 domain-containing protein [Gammaproteobacteria bacterium]|nr:DUF2834 domain-containing protein [Gammaproteobacteria bacterium]